MHQRIEQEISYLRGFLAGDQTFIDKQHQVLDRMLFVMEQLTEEFQQLNLRLTELEEYVEAVDEDLDDVEQLIFEDEEEIDQVRIICPACEEEVMIDQEDLQNTSVECLCPNCHAILINHSPRQKETVEYELKERI